MRLFDRSISPRRSPLTLSSYNPSLAIVAEDFGGKLLKDLFCDGETATGRLPSEEFLKIAIAVAETLLNIHDANIIHKDLSPKNYNLIIWKMLASLLNI